MTIQIFTDASVQSTTHEAGYACWISCMQLEVQMAGYLGKQASTAFAEVEAINHAVTYLLNIELIPLTGIEIFTDSTEAIHRIVNGKRGDKTPCTEVFFNLVQLMLNHGFTPHQTFDKVRIRHVKAHTKLRTFKADKNRWCDTSAKYYRINKGHYKNIIYDHSDILL